MERCDVGCRGRNGRKKKQLTIEELLGVGVGVLGMSLNDWEALSPEEFEACWHAHADEMERVERGEWERMRLLATIVVQPHCKSKLTARKLLPLPWDGHREPPAVKLSPEERHRRMERARGLLGG